MRRESGFPKVLDIGKGDIQFFQHGDGVVGIELEYGIITVSVVADQFGLQYTDLIVVKESLLFYSAESGEFAGGEVPFRLFS